MNHKQIAQNKILSLPSLVNRLAAWRFKEQKIVFTNGCFDILHTGHLQTLQTAISYGHILIVGLNSDDSVKRLKGPKRPINNENDRAFMLASLFCVDVVVLFEEDTPLNLIEAIQPDVLVKGGDYEIKDIVGADVVVKNGGEVLTIPLVEGLSTTNTIDKMGS